MNFKVNLNICRVCMKSEKGQSLLEDEELRSKFVLTTCLALNESDDMPAIICAKCVIRLKVAYEFVQLAHASEKNIKAFLTKISNDFQLFTTTGTERVSSVSESDIDAILLDDKASSATQQKHNCENYINDTLKRTPVQPNNVTEKVKPTSTAVKQTSIKDEEHSLTFKEEKLDNVEINRAEVVREFMVFEGENFLNDHMDNEERLKVYNKDLSQSDEMDIHEISDDNVDGLDSFHEGEGELQTHIEMMDDETLNQADESNDHQAHHDKDGYFKEYEAMLEENGNNYDDDNDDEHSMEELHLQELEQEEPDVVNTQAYLMLEDTETSSSVARLMTTIIEKNESSSSNQIMPSTHARTTRTKPKTTTTTTTISKETLQPSTAYKSNTMKSKKPLQPSSNGTRFFCVKCNRDFSTKTNLTRHMSTHEGSKPYECTECGKRFTQNGSLKQHLYTHTGEKPYVCVVCDRGFTQCKSLVFHMRRHTGEKPFPCDQCGLSFRQKDGLKAHILKHHVLSIEKEDGIQSLNTCVICKKQFTEAHTLQLHMKKHINNHRGVGAHHSNEQESNILLNLMKDDELLSEKSFIHGELALDDDDEDASTHVVDLLATSATEPNRAKKFQCRQCFKCFAIKKNLIRHLSIHTVSMSDMFQCELCEIAFDTNLGLKSHRIRDHRDTGFILNQCDECQITFQNESELKEHIILSHDSNCPECPGLSFKSHKLLMEHMLEHELNEMDENV